MSKFSELSIQSLWEFQSGDWYDFFDSVFLFKKLPRELQISYEFSSEYFIALNHYLNQNAALELLANFHKSIVSYYFDLPITQDSFPKIFTLHWLFANLKIRVSTDKFYHQLFKETLCNLYFEGVHLQSSLLSLLIELPNVEHFDASPYLFSNSLSIRDLSFYRVACRYFIQKSNISDYVKYVNIISNDNNKELPKIITESIMDCRDYYGSFKHLFFEIKDFWNHFYETNNELARSVIDILNVKYLNIGKKWYNNDIYATLFKMLINSIHYPPPIPDVARVYYTIESSNSAKKNELLKAVTFVLKNNKGWKSQMKVDPLGDENQNLISIYDYDDETAVFYEKSYGIKKSMSFVLNADSGFVSLITRNCNPEYESIKEYDSEYLNYM